MYYSVGYEERLRIRVPTATQRPATPDPSRSNPAFVGIIQERAFREPLRGGSIR